MLICPECNNCNVNESDKYCSECGCPIDFIKNNQPVDTKETLLICPECSAKVKMSEEYCLECGCPIDYIIKNQPEVEKEVALSSLICPACGASVSLDQEYCPDCGYPVSSIINEQIATAAYSASTDVSVLLKGAEDGDSEAMYWLGYHYFYDEEDENEDLAKKWWLESAQNGNHKAKADYEKNFQEVIDLTTESTITPFVEKYPLKKLFDKYDSIIAVDTETSGLDFVNNRVIELAAVKLVTQNGNIVVADQMDNLIKLPLGTTLDYKITQLTNITDQQLNDEGLDSSLVFNNFVNMFAGEKVLIVAYNAHFDLSFLYYSLVREGLDYVLKQIDMLDALTIFKDRREYPHKLENAIDAYNLSNIVANTHRAIDDTLALVEILKSMDTECDDLDCYINLFGYNPKYGVQGRQIQSVNYLPQYYNSYKKLYE